MVKRTGYTITGYHGVRLRRSAGKSDRGERGEWRAVPNIAGNPWEPLYVSSLEGIHSPNSAEIPMCCVDERGKSTLSRKMLFDTKQPVNWEHTWKRSASAQ